MIWVGDGGAVVRRPVCGTPCNERIGGIMVNVIVADNQEMYRAGVVSLLSGTGDDRVISQFSDWVTLFSAVATNRQSLIVVSTSLILELKLLIARTRSSGSRVLLIAEDCDSLGRYLASGVSGIVRRSSSPSSFLEVARKIRKSTDFVMPTEETLMVRIRRTGLATHLTLRELRIVGLLMEGLKNRRIAEHLNIAEHAVRSRFQKIYEKTGFTSRLELAIYISQHSEIPTVQLLPISHYRPRW